MEFLGLVSSALLVALLALIAGPAAADAPALDAGVEQQVRALALAGSARTGTARVEVEVGQLDPRLRLAPCQQVEPYLPAGTRLWGRTRIGVRCVQGTSKWNVFLPVTAKVYGQALVAAAPLSAGTVVAEADLKQAEVDLADGASMALTDPRAVVGRTLTRAINAGQGLRQADLKVRLWFAAGETVSVVAQGNGFSVAGEGQALTAGLEGQPAKVKTESGRVLTGMPVGERRLEVGL